MRDGQSDEETFHVTGHWTEDLTDLLKREWWCRGCVKWCTVLCHCVCCLLVDSKSYQVITPDVSSSWLSASPDKLLERCFGHFSWAGLLCHHQFPLTQWTQYGGGYLYKWMVPTDLTLTCIRLIGWLSKKWPMRMKIILTQPNFNTC